MPSADQEYGGSGKAFGSKPLRLLTGVSVGLAGIALVGLLDWSTGTEISLSILYLIPIGLAVWFGGLTSGLIVSAAAAGIWLVLDTFSGSAYSHPWIPYWNAAVRLGLFLLTTFLLDRVRFFNSRLDALVRERTAALVAEVAQRKEAEAVVRESETRFRQLAENIREVFWVSDPGKKEISYVSPAYEVIWGRKCESLYAAARNWLEAVHPHDRERVREAAHTRQVSGQYEEVYRIERPDGAIRWIQDRAFPVRNDSGEVFRIVGIAEDITRRKESEAQLAMLAQALESTAELICITDLEDRFTFVNRAFQAAFGYAEAEILGKTPQLLYSPDNPPALMAEILAETRRGGWQGEVLDRRKDGTEFPIFLSTSQIKDPTGQVVGLIGVSRDITERKRAEKQTAVFGSLAHKLSAATQPEDAAQIILDLASELFGWDAGYLHLYSSAEDRIIPILTVDTVDGRRAPVPTASFTLDPSPLMRRVMAEGAQLINRSAESSVSVTLVPFGAALRRSASMMYVPILSSGTVIGVLSIQSYTDHAYSRDDLTLLHALADHCGDALQRIKLAAATRELAAIVENSGDAIITNSPDGTIVSWNKGAERLYGYTAEEIKGRSLAVLVPPEQHSDLPAIIERFSRSERMSDFETIRLRKDGARIELSVNISPIRDAAGHVTGASVIERDITERKRLEREIADISQHEQQRLAHELHDHLGAYLTGIAFRMKALAEALDRHAVPEADAARELVKLVNAGTDQVRNFARLLAPVEVASGGLAAALFRLGAEMESLFGIICRVEIAPDLPALTNEQGLQLYRIAQEAARNAVQHGKARQVEISVRHDLGSLIQTIRNDGQAWDATKVSTNSFGLRIMHYRAGSLGGTLALQSDASGRTAVICQLPLPQTSPIGPADREPSFPGL